MSLPVSLPVAGPAASPTLADALENCRLALAAYVAAPEQADVWAKFLQARREAASAIVLLADSGRDAPEAKAIIELQRQIAASGAYDAVAASEDILLVGQIADSGPLGLLAAMLLVSPVQWPAAPLPQQVPFAYRNVYTAWLFYTPQGFRAAS